MSTVLDSVVRTYLEELEHQLKQLPCVEPEEALSDAREHLQNELDSMGARRFQLSAEERMAHLTDVFGDPEQVASQYAEAAGPAARLGGYAPGWRICCTRCGRSAPAAQAGIIRIGAWSWHKYIGGYCRGCRRFRWLRLIKDLDNTNLTKRLGATTTAGQVRHSLHRPWTVILLIVALVLGSQWLIHALLNEAPNLLSEELPAGWKRESSQDLSPDQTATINQKLGTHATQINNTVLAVGGQRLRVNSITCDSVRAAERLADQLAGQKRNPRMIARRDNTVFEFLGEPRLAIEARYRLGIQPARVTYRVTFDAAPLERSEDMAWNRLVNLFLSRSPDAERNAAVDAQIAEQADAFQFGEELTLRQFGQGDVKSRWKLTPAARDVEWPAGGNSARYHFDELPRRAGVPFVSVAVEITSQTGAVTPLMRSDVDALTKPTDAWPATDAQVKQLAANITQDHDDTRDKVRAIHGWLQPGTNIKYGGGVVGSRYGVRQVLDQKFGRCWDFSDVFVTLCRASGIPARQVAGWLYGAEGHVWAEAMVDDKGWVAFDPTSIELCGSDYIPFVTIEDGNMPLLYVSEVRIEIIE